MTTKIRVLDERTTGLRFGQLAGGNGTELKKANLPKGRDAKLPVYGIS